MYHSARRAGRLRPPVPFLSLTAYLAISLSAVASAGACVGDCNGDSRVTIDEVLVGVNIANGGALLSSCPAFDQDGDGKVLVNEVLQAVNAALDGCQAGSCTGCPAGFACGSANGIPVCRSAQGIPAFNHVFVIMMENTSLATLQNGNAPYLAQLAATAATSGDYHALTHPSLPNYLALTSGDDGGVACDCTPVGDTCSPSTCNIDTANCGCVQPRSNLAGELEAIGKTWKSYAEDIGVPCNLTDTAIYSPRHVPFLYYDRIQGDATECATHVVDYSVLAADLQNGTPNFVFITPNLRNDMHDPIPAGPENLTAGDNWLAAEVPKILASRAYQDNGVLFIAWDESDGSGDDPIPFYLISPLARQGGYVSQVRADHYALLATWEDGLGVARLGRSAAATPLADFFPAQ